MQEARFVRSEEELAERLQQLAASLHELSSDADQSIRVQRNALRYAPFLARMAEAHQFVEDLFRVAQASGVLVLPARSELRHLVDRYRLPVLRGYSADKWSTLLQRSLVSIPGDFERLPQGTGFVNDMEWGEYEVHFVYPGPELSLHRERPGSFLLAQRIPDNESEREIRDRLEGPVRRILDDLKKHTKKVQWQHFLPYVSVRVSLLTAPFSIGSKAPPLPPALKEPPPEEVAARRWLRIEPIDIFSFEWVQDERIEKTTSRMLDDIIGSLRNADLFVFSQGRKPDSESLARYWRAIVLDGLTIEELAIRETGTDGDVAINREESLRKLLRDYGIK